MAPEPVTRPAPLEIDPDPEVAQFAVDQLELLRGRAPLGEVEGDLPSFDDPEATAEIANMLRVLISAADALAGQELSGDEIDPDLLPAIESLARVRSGTATLGDLIPSNEELDENPELEAWFAGGGPAPASSLRATRPRHSPRADPPPRRAVPVERRARVAARPRERRARPARSRARSPGRSADEPHEPAPALAGSRPERRLA
jgi:hypothetical protein